MGEILEILWVYMVMLSDDVVVKPALQKNILVALAKLSSCLLVYDLGVCNFFRCVQSVGRWEACHRVLSPMYGDSFLSSPTTRCSPRSFAQRNEEEKEVVVEEEVSLTYAQDWRLPRTVKKI